VTANASAEHAARDAAAVQAVANAAAELGVDHEVIETEEDADYGPNIQSFVEHAFRIVVTVGEAVGPTTIAAARGAPDVLFIGIDQPACVTADGAPDPEGVCAGDAAALIPNYQAVVLADSQAAYLAGIVAATVSEHRVLGVVGGSTVPWVVRSWRGFQNGARSVTPNVDVRFVALAGDASGFGDPAPGRAAAEQLATDGVDVIFELAGDAGPGVIEGACASGIRAIGSVVDQARALPDQGCIVTSAEARYGEVITAAVERAAAGDLRSGPVMIGLADDPPGVGLSPVTGGVTLSPDTTAIFDAAARALAGGTLDPCRPVACTESGS
jgi:basic membrane protein A